MKFLSHFVNNTLFLYLQRKEKLYSYNFVFFGIVLAFAYCLGLIFIVLNSFRTFYTHDEFLWISVLTILILSTTDNYFQVFKDSCKHIISIFIGGVVSIASISIVGRSVWPNIFIMLVFFFVTPGFFLTSNFFSHLHSKNMYITYYFMVFLVHFPLLPTKDYFYSPVPQLKFLSVSGIAMVICMFTCLVFRYSFATDLFVQASNLLLKQSRFYLKELDKNLNVQIIKSINSENNDRCELGEKVFCKIRDELFKDCRGPCDQMVCNMAIEKEIKSSVGKLRIIYNDYSRILNRLDSVYKQSLVEFWSKDLFIHLERLQILFERNHKKLYALYFGLAEEFQSEICKKMIRLVPFTDILFKEIDYIFNIMSKQLTLRLVHDPDNKEFQEWFHLHHNNSTHNMDDPINETGVNTTSSNSIPNIQSLDSALNENKDRFKVNSMEWYQLELYKSFETISTTVLKMQNIKYGVFERDFLTDPEYNDAISRVSFFISGFEKFSIEQKSLSDQLFLLSYHLSLSSQYPQEVKFAKGLIKYIIDYFNNYKRNKKIKELEKKRDDEAFPPIIRVKYTKKEKAIALFDYIVLKRMLFNWLYSLKYALGSSIIVISIYELRLRSTFILWNNIEWIAVIFVVICSPIVGALPIQTALRIFGALLGGFLGYAVLIIMGLVTTRVAQAFIYIGFSFFAIAGSFVLVKQQPFEKIILYIVFGYSIITQFQYQSFTHNTIQTLLRILHICIGLLAVMAVGFILPYYDYRQLEKNLYQLPFGIVKSFSFLMSFSFISSRQICHRSSIIFNNNYQNNNINNNNDIRIDQNLSTSGLSHTSHTDYNSMNSDNLSTSSESWSHFRSVYKDNIIPSIASKGLTFQQYRMLISKVNIELRSNFPLQRSLLLDAKFELTFRKKKYKRIETIYLAVEKLHNIFGALDFVISESNHINLQHVGSSVKDKIINVLYELNTTSHYLYNVTAFKKDVFKEENLQHLDRDNSINLVEDLINGIRSYMITNSKEYTISQIIRCNAICFILRSFSTQYNIVFNLLYDFQKRINIKKVKTNNHNITKPNEALNPDAINYHLNVNEEIKDVRNYQILKILTNK